MENVRQRDWMKDTGVDEDGNAEVPALRASHEYASLIVEARLHNKPFAFNGNVMNHGSITNLPDNCCVEVSCLADAEGVHPTFVGDLPTQCAALNRTNINVQELAVEAVLRRDREAAFHACALDPLTASVVPLPELRQMFAELWAAEGDRLSYFDD
jgi:alpha-galactosidase